LPADPASLRSRRLEAARAIVAGRPDPVDRESISALAGALAPLAPPPDEAIPAVCAAGYALGWADPSVAGEILGPAGRADPSSDVIVLGAVVLGVHLRVSEALAGIVDCRPVADPVRQMLGARLADERALGAAIEIAHDDLVSAVPTDGGEDGPGVALGGLLALAGESALRVCEVASLAGTHETRRRVERRQAWLVEVFARLQPLALLDVVAADLAGAGPP
jgi:hypothetical protein